MSSKWICEKRQIDLRIASQQGRFQAKKKHKQIAPRTECTCCKCWITRARREIKANRFLISSNPAWKSPALGNSVQGNREGYFITGRRVRIVFRQNYLRKGGDRDRRGVRITSSTVQQLLGRVHRRFSVRSDAPTFYKDDWKVLRTTRTTSKQECCQQAASVSSRMARCPRRWLVTGRWSWFYP